MFCNGGMTHDHDTVQTEGREGCIVHGHEKAENFSTNIIYFVFDTLQKSHLMGTRM